jgi:hypothetical protein
MSRKNIKGIVTPKKRLDVQKDRGIFNILKVWGL